jgi:hypothetical protein
MNLANLRADAEEGVNHVSVPLDAPTSIKDFLDLRLGQGRRAAPGAAAADTRTYVRSHGEDLFGSRLDARLARRARKPVADQFSCRGIVDTPGRAKLLAKGERKRPGEMVSLRLGVSCRILEER